MKSIPDDQTSSPRASACLQGADDVVGLAGTEDRDAVGAHHVAQILELLEQVLGRAFAGRLVLGELRLERRPWSKATAIESAVPTRKRRSTVVKSVGRTVSSAVVSERAGEVGAVGQGRAVEQKARHGRNPSWRGPGSERVLAKGHSLGSGRTT